MTRTVVDLGLTTFPVGTVLSYAGSTAPTDWLLCFGQAVSRTTYAGLFAVVGTTYGAGDGSTTFNVPDLRGRVAAGKDDMGGSAAGRLTNTGTGNPGINGATLGASGGVDRHTMTTAEMPAHTHPVGAQNSQGLSGGGLTVGVSGGSSPYNSGSQGSGNAHPNTQPTIVLNSIIKI
jgi:microcystin-dependent protein